jgi:hypothetical protein
MSEHQAVRLGPPRIIGRIFTDSSHTARRSTITNREIDGQENKKAYFNSIVASSESQVSNQLEAFRKERPPQHHLAVESLTLVTWMKYIFLIFTVLFLMRQSLKHICMPMRHNDIRLDVYVEMNQNLKTCL